jgi:hypothetical protein
MTSTAPGECFEVARVPGRVRRRWLPLTEGYWSVDLASVGRAARRQPMRSARDTMIPSGPRT